MKRIILLIILFFAAVALSPILINEKGYILIAMGDLTIESTVVTGGILLFIFILSLLILLKVLKGGVRLGRGSWHNIVFAKQRKGQENFQKGITAFILEDYPQAETLLAKAAEPSKQQICAYLLAATASEKQKLSSNTQHYLKLLEDSWGKTKNTSLDVVVVSLKLLLNSEKFDLARQLLDKYHTSIGHDERLLKLEIILCIHEQRFETVVEYLPKARKAKSVTEAELAQWEKVAYQAVFKELIIKQDYQALGGYWQKIPNKLKQSQAIVLAYCEILSEHNFTQDIEKILLPVVKKATQAPFIRSLRHLPLKQCQALITQVQRHLHKDPHNGLWLSYLAHLAYHNQQWGMAEKAFNSLMAVEPKAYCREDLLIFSEVLLTQKSPEQALQVLKMLQDEVSK